MNNFRKIFALLMMLASCGPAAYASQNAVVLPTSSPYPGLTMLNNINSAFNTFQTNFSGSSAPSSPATDQLWFDTSNNALKIYDGSSWYPIGVMSSGWTVTSSGFKQLAVTSTGSANAYVVTYAPVPTAYVTGQKYSFIANFANTGAATFNANAIGAKPLKKQGGVALASGDIGIGLAVECVYDGTNCQITSQISTASSGTVTSVATNNGITGGTITTSGTIGLSTIGTNTILANNTGSTAVPVGTSLTALMDANLGSTQGQIAYRNASVWTVLSPGTNGQVLTSGGASANPSWTTATGGFSSCTQVTGSSGAPSTASCAGGYTMTGGGAFADTSSSSWVGNSYPSGSTTWQCDGGFRYLTSVIGASCTAYAICCH